MNIMAFGIAGGVALTYFLALFFFQFFFQGKIQYVPSLVRSISIISGIFLVGLAVVAVSQLISDVAFGNRVLHIFGGGFLASIACFFGAKDCGIPFSRFQLFVLVFLLVTALGVGNELLEFLLQTTTSKLFATSIADTWLDLLSNTVGIFLACLAIFPLYFKNK